MLVNLIEWLQKPDRLKVPHRGIVVDNNDPKKLGRVKVNIVALFDGIATADLPWVSQVTPAGFGGQSGASSFAVPDVGAELKIVFPFDDIYFGFYDGFWQSSSSHQAVFDTNYPSRYGFRDANGLEFLVDKSTNVATVTHPSGTVIQIDGAGNITFTSAAGVTITAPSGLNINADITHTGNNTQTGDLDVTGTLINNGINFGTHVHGGIVIGGNNTQGPQ